MTPADANGRLDLSALEPRLRAAVLEIARRVQTAGGCARMVGGSVRDLLSGEPQVTDVDLEVFGLAPARLRQTIGAAFAFDECGMSFGVLKLKHLDIDISLPRREEKRRPGHRGFDVFADPTMSVRAAAARRDFTINALYYDPLAARLEDPYGGLADLRDRILRHVSPRFVEDPLRVLRGMQFVARFNLTPAPETVAVCRRMPIENLPPERLFEEWAKLLTKGRMISRGLDFLRAVEWTRYFPELQALIGCRQDPHWHPEGDVWDHTRMTLDAFARHRLNDSDEDLIVGLAVLCHDFGKPLTTAWDPVKRRLRSLGHDEAGVAPTRSFLRRLTREERLLREVPPLVRCHMRPFAMWKAKAGDAAIRRLALAVGRIDRLLRVVQADELGHAVARTEGHDASAEALRWLAAQAERLRVAAEMPKPILMGRHLLEMGFHPSKSFKKMLDDCFVAQLDGKFSDLPGAKAYFRTNFL
ncbi:MAG: CCA tRNA nucleotidyltransferase [Kiritimatiellia bacterium]